MRNFYYEIWVDAIVSEREKNGNRRNWKIFALIPISVIQGINLLTLLFWLIPVTKNFSFFFKIDVFRVKALNSFFSAAITLFVPFIILNYFLILNGNRYEQLLKKYNAHNGKLYLYYFLLSMLIFLVPIIIGHLFFGL